MLSKARFMGAKMKVGQVVTATVRACTDHGIYVSVAEDPKASIRVDFNEIAWADPVTIEFLCGIPRFQHSLSVGEQIDILLIRQGDRNHWGASIKRLIKTLPTYNPQKYCVGSIHTAVVSYRFKYETLDSYAFTVADGLTFQWEAPPYMNLGGIRTGDSALIEVTEDIYNLEQWFHGNTCRFIQRITSEERGFPIAWRPEE